MMQHSKTPTSILSPVHGISSCLFATQPGTQMTHEPKITSGEPALRYWTAGNSGPKVLLIMGYGMRGEIWEPQISGLKDSHQLTWFDNRGVGESDMGPKSRWTMSDMAGDVLSVMDALGWDTCHLVGVSMGGMIAQEVALTASHRLQSLTLIVTHAGGVTLSKLPTMPGLRAFFGVARANTEQRIESLKKLLYPAEFLATTDEDALNARIKMRIGRPLPKNIALGQLRAIFRHDTRKRLGSLQLPTLIIKASKDILVRPQASDRLHALIPNAELLEISDAGHGVIFQSAATVNEALTRHITTAEQA